MEYNKLEAISLLAIQTLKGVGYWSLFNFKKEGNSFQDIFKGDLEKAAMHFKIDPEYLTESSLKNLWMTGLSLAKEYSKKGIVILFKNDPSFPKRLKEIQDPPEWLFIEGSIQTINKKCAAIVGSRECDKHGLFLTRIVVALLSEYQCATVSGLAKGIDQEAHSASIEYGVPTIAVLGTGIEKNYPAGSEYLRNKIIENDGAIITEYLPNQSYSKENFVRRNRIQAALSELLIPTQWRIKSGTSHTVKYSKSYNRTILMPIAFDHEIKNRESSHIKDYDQGHVFLLPYDSKKTLGLFKSIFIENKSWFIEKEIDTQEKLFEIEKNEEPKTKKENIQLDIFNNKG